MLGNLDSSVCLWDVRRCIGAPVPGTMSLNLLMGLVGLVRKQGFDLQPAAITATQLTLWHLKSGETNLTHRVNLS